jgi:hypothetical protein
MDLPQRTPRLLAVVVVVDSVVGPIGFRWFSKHYGSDWSRWRIATNEKESDHLLPFCRVWGGYCLVLKTWAKNIVGVVG